MTSLAPPPSTPSLMSSADDAEMFDAEAAEAGEDASAPVSDAPPPAEEQASSNIERSSKSKAGPAGQPRGSNSKGGKAAIVELDEDDEPTGDPAASGSASPAARGKAKAKKGAGGAKNKAKEEVLVEDDEEDDGDEVEDLYEVDGGVEGEAEDDDDDDDEAYGGEEDAEAGGKKRSRPARSGGKAARDPAQPLGAVGKVPAPPRSPRNQGGGRRGLRAVPCA